MLAIVALACAGTAAARSSDRNQPMDIDAGSQSGTFEANSVNVLSGGVHITQGTLDIRSARAEISLAGGDPSRALLTGSPVVLTQQMDDGTPMTAHASKVDYNLQTEIVVFTGNVQIQQPRGTMSGQRVVYNLRTGRVDSGGAGAGRVKMRILPRAAQGRR
ncbi:MAG: lipopolysaccharide transport periplasmic protein LptA [Gammaproteobacteria bacterium]|nr:lipopolysaccharide transport periplasmic protein LptA [Gammaproteobacteria bacterium]